MNYLDSILQSLNKDPSAMAVWIALAMLLGGLILAFVIKKLQLGDSVTLVALLLVPLITYGIVSGKISEFSGPGGWSAKFQAVAKKQIAPESIIRSIENAEVIAKGDYVRLQNVTETLFTGKPIALTLKLGRGGYYQAPVISEYLRVLLGFDAELKVIIMDSGDRYAVSADGQYLVSVLADEDERSRFMSALRSDSSEDIKQLSGFIDESILLTATNVDALRFMEERNADRLVAISLEGKPNGILSRRSITTTLLIELATED